MDKITFAGAAAPYLQHGRFPPGDLLPLIPPGAKIAEGSSVKPSQVGKIPGRYRAGEWWGLGGEWPTAGLSPADQAKAQIWPTENIGLRAAEFPAIDCDVATEEARELVHAVITQHLGSAPIRRRSNSPRALYCFRKKGNDAIRKIRLVFSDGVNEHAVELLGSGQQYVINGVHPSGVLYTWVEGLELARISADGLTRHEAVDFARFFDQLRLAIEAQGWVVKSLTNHAKNGVKGGIGYDTAQMDPLVDPKLALAALDAIPNTMKDFPTRESFIAIIAAFKACVGRDAEKYHDHVLQWANATDPGVAHEEWFDPIWDDVRVVHVGPEYLFQTARKFGFFLDAVADFDDQAVMVGNPAAAEPVTEKEIIEKLSADVIYWAEEQIFIYKPKNEMLSANAFNSYPGLGTQLAPAGTSGVKSAANRMINSGVMTVVQGTTYYPGQPQIVRWDQGDKDGAYYNRWRTEPVTLPKGVTDADVEPWLGHVKFLLPDPDDHNDLLDFLAHVVQFRGRKIRWAPIIISGQGVGKGVMMVPFMRFLGASNYGEIGPERMQDRFNKFFEKELLVIEEMARFGKIDAYNSLKALITGTGQDTITIEKKFEPTYSIPNTLNMIFFSNHADAVAPDKDDRRFRVLNSFVEKKDGGYYQELVHWYETQDGWQKVIAWLKARDLSKFNPDAEPRETDAKQEMIAAGEPYYVTALREELTNGRLAKRDVIHPESLLVEIQNDFNFPPALRREVTKTSDILRALPRCGWVKKPNPTVRLRVNQGGVRVWCRTKEIALKPGDEIRAIWEAGNK